MGRTSSPPGPLRWGVPARLLAGLIVTLALLGATEAALRLQFGPAEPPILVVSGVGDLPRYFETTRGGLRPTYQHRPLGTIPLQVERPRIAVLGGSSVRGGSIGVEPAEEFAGLLGPMLGVETLNLGNPSIDSHDLVRITAELTAARFDAWVVYTGHNDYGNAYFHQRYARWRSSLQAHLRSRLERLQIFCQLRALLGRDAVNRATPDGSRQFSAPPIGPHQRSAAAHYLRSNLERIAWTAESAGVPLVLVLPASSLLHAPVGRCDEEPCARVLWETASQTTDPAEASELYRAAREADTVPLRMPSAGADAIRQVADDRELLLVDAAIGLPRAGDLEVPQKALFLDVVHLSRAGHLAMAELLTGPLTELLGDRALGSRAPNPGAPDAQLHRLPARPPRPR